MTDIWTGKRVSPKVQGLGLPRPPAGSPGARPGLWLDGKRLDARIDGAIRSGALTRTIEGASTLSLTVSDPERFLMRGGYFARRADLEFDDLWFRLVRFSKSGDDMGLTFEDREVNILRKKTKARRFDRAKYTRAQALKALVGEVPHILFVCPELNRRQTITATAKTKTKVDTVATDTPTSASLRNRDRGISLDAVVTMKDAGGNRFRATRAQIGNINIVLRACQAVGAGPKATLAAVMAGMVENHFTNSSVATDHTSTGVFQVLSSTARGVGVDPLDVEACTKVFLRRGFWIYGGAIELARKNPGQSAGWIAQRCQGSAYPGRYDQVRDEATKIIEQFGGVDGGPTSDGTDSAGGSSRVTSTRAKSYLFTRGAPGGPTGENTWDCGLRLSAEVGWRWFIVAGVVYFISDYELIRSEPRITLNERSRGVDNIDFELDESAKAPDTVTIAARADLWAAPPGTVVALDAEMGEAEGAWIVSQIERPELYENDVTITLVKPHAAKLEPAPETETLTRTTSPTPGTSTTKDGGTNAGTVVAGLPGKIEGTPAHIINAYALPIARRNGIQKSVAQNDTDNANHTHLGSSSDHAGPREFKWATDLGIGPDIRHGNAEGAARGDRVAKALAEYFGIEWSGAGLKNAVHDGYRFQLIWRYEDAQAGNHYDHIHFGVRKA